ncbi:hypothetical protein HU200_058230 [Digitaria exilis]|uniref:Selenoprotein H n=1 Tax=Digitaria exilis TaxID=1010633 RepID=A0A835E3M5_9POAL|nr:hypothetical protein HU200_058230 [Digitaria exilis]CAB3462036.1 unnamed protein product [Digitaria exilis]
MPPKRKSPAVAAPAVRSPRKTRSMTATVTRGAEAAPAKEVPPKKKEEEAAAVEPKGRKRAKKDDAAVTVTAEPKGRKRGKKDAGEAVPAAEEDGGDAAAEGKRIIVEACTQCRQFKIRAQKVKEDLESSVTGVSVIINPQKPRRGCLEIREEGGEVFLSLLNMPRPFTPMKKLDMDEVIKDIAKKIS